jgi:hypothetical protein
MKILITTHTQFKKNAFSKHLERATSLAKRGHEVTFLITSDKNRFKTEIKHIDGVRVILMPDLLWGVYRQGVDPVNILRRCREVMRLDYDIIHGIDCRPATILPALLAKFLRGK